jgi:DnaJ-class molecular chaperone
MTAPPSTETPSKSGTHLKPGDEAAPGTSGTGEDICPECSGTGKLKDGNECPTCEGSGRIIQAIGGG